MRQTKEYNVSFRCYFPGADNKTQHYMTMPLKDIAKWIEAYRFTHPTLQSITVKVWMQKDERGAHRPARAGAGVTRFPSVFPEEVSGPGY